VVNARSRPTYPRERDLVPIAQEAGWVPALGRTGAEISPFPGFDLRTVQLPIPTELPGPQPVVSAATEQYSTRVQVLFAATEQYSTRMPVVTGSPKGGPRPDRAAYVFVFLARLIICGLYKLTLPDQAQVTQQMVISFSNLALRF